MKKNVVLVLNVPMMVVTYHQILPTMIGCVVGMDVVKNGASVSWDTVIIMIVAVAEYSVRT